ncbi:MAG: O-antigen ligase family protein [Planctomycetota bacterium]|nr:O-antigen ligase family protein [Planctomycetota bacterium]
MPTIGQQKVDTLTITAVFIAVAATAALSLAWPVLMPWSFLGLGAAALFFYWVSRWEISLWAWVWVLSYGLLNWPNWRIEVTGFFNMTVPRFIFVAAVLAFLLHFMLRRRPVRFDRGLLWAMLFLTAYCAVSATLTGWVAQTPEVRAAPYFRFLSAMLFPFIMFFLVYNSTRNERQIHWALLLLSIYGWYAIYIGYLQYTAIIGFGQARSLIWPACINDSTVGIHFDRARGAFGAAGPQSVLLVVLFYADLLLIRKIRGLYRAALIVQAALIPPAIFFTGIRAAYLAFALCGIVWCLWASRRRFGGVKLALASLAVLVAAVMLWGNLTQTKRQTGGVAQREPIVARYILLKQTWEMVKQRPLTGVGFGHFVDAQQAIRRDPSRLVGLSTGVLVEHNLFLNMVAETGIIGLAGSLLVFWLVYRQSVQLYRKLPEGVTGILSREFVVLFWIVLVNYLTTAMFRDTLWAIFSNGMFWSLAGLVAGYNRLLEPHAANSLADASAVPG